MHKNRSINHDNKNLKTSYVFKSTSKTVSDQTKIIASIIILPLKERVKYIYFSLISNDIQVFCKNRNYITLLLFLIEFCVMK